jgi:hypothetical protein
MFIVLIRNCKPFMFHIQFCLSSRTCRWSSKYTFHLNINILTYTGCIKHGSVKEVYLVLMCTYEITCCLTIISFVCFTFFLMLLFFYPLNRNYLSTRYPTSVLLWLKLNKGNNKITELRTIFRRESQNS